MNGKIAKKAFALSCILLQLTITIFMFPATASQPLFSADSSGRNEPASSSLLSGSEKPVHQSQDATGFAASTATSALNHSAEQWLSQFGTAEVKLRTDPHFNLQGSSLDLLLPLNNVPSDVTFTQGGVRYNDDRVTTNIGFGHRHFYKDWMLGINMFYDSTWNNVNRRFGLGLETWMDNLRVSSNLYSGNSEWHNSRSHKDYEERPADGWDIRAEGWLPSLPQLGMKAVYEQYYGNNVALFDAFSDRQNNPHAFTVGINYTPVPLITIGADHKMGKAGINDTQLSLAVNYRLGESWDKQISPENVATLHELHNSRLDLVNRNNEIVLDYRKQSVLQLSFPPRISGQEYSVYTFAASVQSTYGFERLELDDAELIRNGGQVISVRNGVVTLKLPAATTKPVRLSGVAIDRKGNRSNLAETLIEAVRTESKPVNRPDVAMTAQITVDRTQAYADGRDAVIYTVTVKDEKNQPVSGQEVKFSTDLGVLASRSGITDSNGQVNVRLTSTTPGTATVTATAANQNLAAPAVRFIAEAFNVAISVDKKFARADGIDKFTYTLTLADSSDKPVQGQTVRWSTDFGTLSSQQGVTDENGQVQVQLTSRIQGEANVSASVNGSTVGADRVNFEPRGGDSNGGN